MAFITMIGSETFGFFARIATVRQKLLLVGVKNTNERGGARIEAGRGCQFNSCASRQFIR